MLSCKLEIMPSLNLPVWLVVFLIWGFDDLGKTNVLACNTFGDYCDSLDEHPIDTSSATTSDATEILPEDTPYFVNHYNDSEDKEIGNDRTKRASSSTKNEEMTSSQVTTILDRLLFESGYDRQIRPQINGPPVHVKICQIKGDIRLNDIWFRMSPNFR